MGPHMLCALALTCLGGMGAAPGDTRCYELRIYTAAPGKLDALKSRFKDHTCALFTKHGFTNIGYWVPVENPDNKFIYMLASPSREAHSAAWKAFSADPEWKDLVKTTEAGGKLVTKVESIYLKATDFSPKVAPSSSDAQRCFELRTYTAAPSKLDALQERFRDHTMKLFTKYGMTNIGYWTRTEKDQNQLIYILAHKSKAAGLEAFAKFRDDPEWKEVKKASEVNGSLTEKVESLYMEPLDFSPIK